jgi:hypothetical protein
MPILFYAFTLWLGAYVMARNSQKTAVRLTGWGLFAYALALATQILFNQFILVILLLLALLWMVPHSIFYPKKIPHASSSFAPGS